MTKRTSREATMRLAGHLRRAVVRARRWLVRVLPADGALDLLTGAPNDVTRQALRVAVTLGLPDLLARGPRNVADLADEVEADRDALARLLRHLVAVGAFREYADGDVGLNRISRRLVTHADEPTRSAEFHLDGVGPRLEAVLTAMLYSVKTGQPAYEYVHGASLWDQMAASERLTAAFDTEMGAHARAIGPHLVRAYDWSTIGHVADVGGGNGELMRYLLRANLTMRGTLIEFADAARRARIAMGDSGVGDRCEVIERSFFEPLPEADAYLLAWVLHDWSDDEAAKILRRCRDACPPHGRVLVIEKPIDLVEGTDLDLRMLVFFGGRERTVAEYEELASPSGLVLEQLVPVGDGFSLLDLRPVPT